MTTELVSLVGIASLVFVAFGGLYDVEILLRERALAK